MVPIVTPWNMASVRKIIATMRTSNANVAYDDLFKVCQDLFGEPRSSGTSHAVFKTPWQGDPRINIQNDHGKAKPYQVRQVLKAIDKLNETKGEHDGSS